MKARKMILLMAMIMLAITGAQGQEAYAWLTTDKATLTFCYDNSRSVRPGTTYDLNTGTNNPEWLTSENQRSITNVRFLSGFTDARPTSCYRWFYNMANLTAVSQIWYLNTSSVTNMNGMFGACKSLTAIEVRNSTFDTSKVTDMTFMFWGCQSLTRLDLGGFTFKSGVATGKMVASCSALQFLNLPSSGTYATNAFEEVGTVTEPCTLAYPISFRPMPIDLYEGCYKWNGGFFIDSRKPYAWLSEDGTTLYFQNDDSLARRPTVKFFDIYITGDEDKISRSPMWQNLSSSELSAIRKVVIAPSFNQTRPITCYSWFKNMNYLESITGLDNIRTNLVQNMESMFHNCTRLTELDLSAWNTEKVTNTKSMFMNCYKMKSLNLSNFTFTQNSQYMFHLCYSLRTLIVSGSANNLYVSSDPADEEKLACYGIGKYRADYNPNSERCVLIGPEGWKPSMTAYQASTGYFTFKGGLFIETATPYVALSPDKTTLSFLNDRKNEQLHSQGYTIYSLPESGNPGWYNERATITKVVFDASFASTQPTTCQKWFANMSALEEIVGLKYLDTSKLTSMSEMFFMCSKLKSLDVSHFDTSNVLYFINTFYGCGQLTELDVSHFDTSKVLNMNNMFYGCRKLTSLDVSHFDTSKVTDMTDMFQECEGLTSLDVSSFNTSQVTKFDGMFQRLTNVSLLDLSNFEFSSTATTSEMLRQFGYQIAVNDLPLRLEIPSSAANWDATACEEVGTATNPCTLVYPSDFTPEKTSTGNGYYVWKSGKFKDLEKEPYAVLYGSTLTFYYDTNRNTRTGTVYDLNDGNEIPAWHDQAESVRTVKFYNSFKDYMPTSCAYWFDGMTNLTEINMASVRGNTILNTENVTTMRAMFNNCTSLTDVDAYRLNTSNVVDMNSMFRNCKALQSLDLGTHTVTPDLGKPLTVISLFNTYKVRDMYAMFSGCNSLESITFNAGFTTPNVETMRLMFNGCINLVTLDLSHFNTSKVTDMTAMFQRCNSLNVLDISNFNTSKVENMQMMFYLCQNLNEINGISQFDTSNVTDFTQMFAFCENLQQIDVSRFNTSKSENLNFMFYGCSILTSLDISSFTIPSAEGSYGMLNGCSALTQLTVNASANELESKACQGIGTEDAPCKLVCPSGFTPNPVTERGSDWILWMGGYFSWFKKGDVNHDGKVTVADVMMTVNHVMGKTVSGFYASEADMNDDKGITVADVMQMVRTVIGQ